MKIPKNSKRNKLKQREVSVGAQTDKRTTAHIYSHNDKGNEEKTYKHTPKNKKK